MGPVSSVIGDRAPQPQQSACQWICSRKVGCHFFEWQAVRSGWWLLELVPRGLLCVWAGPRPAPTQFNYVRFAWPRAIFFTLRFCDPRAYSRGLSGFSALRFLRAARLTFLRSSLLRVAVLAISALCSLFKK